MDPQFGTDTAVDRVLELGGRIDSYPYDTGWAGSRGFATLGVAFALIDPSSGSNRPPTSLRAQPWSTILRRLTVGASLVTPRSGQRV